MTRNTTVQRTRSAPVLSAPSTTARVRGSQHPRDIGTWSLQPCQACSDDCPPDGGTDLLRSCRSGEPSSVHPRARWVHHTVGPAPVGVAHVFLAGLGQAELAQQLLHSSSLVR